MTQFLRDRLPSIAVVVAVLGLDRITKAVVEAHMASHTSIPVISGLFDLTYVKNPGGVFGLFRDLSPGIRGVLFTVFPVIAVFLIVLYAKSLPATHRIAQMGLALIFGGAIGNLIDRFKHGYVVDFLDVHWRGHHWPAFNVADSAICIGVGLLVYETFFLRQSTDGADPEHDTP